MGRYIYEQPDWPHFHWDEGRVAVPLAAVRYRQGLLIGQMQALGFEVRQKATLENLTVEVVKTSEIESELLDAEAVRSSIARRLGLEAAGLGAVDRAVEGIVEVMLDATGKYDQPLTAERLLGWHAALFPAGRSGMRRIRVGQWRDDANGPMQVVSGPAGREYVHFQAPPAACLEEEVGRFLAWFNGEGGETGAGTDGVLKAGIAHLWFITLHPFDDGNGRIARAIADMALAQAERTHHRFYSLSAQIRRERGAYYDVLERTQKGGLDITAWMEWFLGCLDRALEGAQTGLRGVLRKAHFWEVHRDSPFNSRQRRMLNRLLDGFEGKLTTSKWARLNQCSHDTALRDIEGLVKLGILVRNPGGGRSTSYSLSKFGES